MQPDQNRTRSILAFTCFSAWLIAFPYEGKVLYALLARAGVESGVWITAAIAAHLAGLLACMLFVRSLSGARRMLLLSAAVCLGGTALFVFSAPLLLIITLLIISFFAGLFICAWSWFFREYTPGGARMDTAAKTLAFSALIMIFINLCVRYVSVWLALGLCALLLGLVLLFVHRIRLEAPQQPQAVAPAPLTLPQMAEPISYFQPLAALCVFIFVITINSGLMFQVVLPAFGGLGFVSEFYWAVPYIACILLINRVAKRVNQAYVLYIAIAMLGFSFIAFAALDRSVWSYLAINTLLLGACGINDLFWWSILGELLDFDRNPARLFGFGLGANVAGVLAGKFIGSALPLDSSAISPTLIGMTVVCLALVLLPPLHRLLSRTLQNNAFLVSLTALPQQQQRATVSRVGSIAGLSERENEIAMLLLKGYPYKLIASRLYISESTVKSHVQNIYGKLGIHSRTELIEQFSAGEGSRE